MKKDVFKEELDRFTNEKVRISAEILLERLPDYFYHIPASSTGKNHPAYALGEGGLVRHVKAAMMFLEEMFRDSAFGEYDEYTKDLIRMTLLLHDGFKSGYENSGHTVHSHPLIMSDVILYNRERLLISNQEAEFVASLIRSHMGPWTTSPSSDKILPLPKTREELLVHLCDYVASRKMFNVEFKELNEGKKRVKISDK